MAESAEKRTRHDGQEPDWLLRMAPAFQAMPESIANNAFELAPSNVRMDSSIPGAGLFGSSLLPPPGANINNSGQSIFANNSAPRQSNPEATGDPIVGNRKRTQEQATQTGEDGTSKKMPSAEAQAQVDRIFGNRSTAPHNTPNSDGQSGGSSGEQPVLTNTSSQQQQAPASSGTGLFGSTTTQNQTTGGGSLFGGNNQQQSQPPQTGGLFGSTTNNNTQQSSGGLFGSTANNPSQPSGGLFGGTNTQQQAQPSGGLFGGTNNQQQSQPRQSGGLFGNTGTQQQSGNTGGLFGGNNAARPNVPGGSLFAGGTAAHQSNPGGSLFGANATGPSTSSVFAGANSGLGNSSNMGAGTNMFARPAQPTTGGSLFASTANQPAQPSLLGAAQHSRLNQAAPFGRLSMGQTAAPTNTVGAVKVDLSNMKSTTRFDDCVDEVKTQLEEIDRMIRQQEDFCKQIEAFCPKHGDDVNSLAPDVEYVRSKADDVEQALVSDAQGVDAQRKNTDKDTKDLERCHRVVSNLALPQAYQYSGSIGSLGSMYASQQNPQQSVASPAGGNYDMDLIGNYFVPMASELQKTVNDYARTLTEIESHMRVMESSAMMQAQQLAQQKNGMGGGQPNGDDTVRELADTLRGFEQSILGVAGVVGECRDGVNELVLGRLGGGLP